MWNDLLPFWPVLLLAYSLPVALGWGLHELLHHRYRRAEWIGLGIVLIWGGAGMCLLILHGREHRQAQQMTQSAVTGQAKTRPADEGRRE